MAVATSRFEKINPLSFFKDVKMPNKEDVFKFAKTIINNDVKMYHRDNKGNYIFFDSKRHYAGECSEEFILYWLNNSI